MASDEEAYLSDLPLWAWECSSLENCRLKTKSDLLSCLLVKG